MVLTRGSNGVFCLADLHSCGFGINEFGVSEAAKFVARPEGAVILSPFAARSPEAQLRRRCPRSAGCTSHPRLGWKQ